MEKVKDYFKRFPNSDEVFESGGKFYHSRGAADSYGNGDVKKHTRKEVESKKIADTENKETDTKKR